MTNDERLALQCDLLVFVATQTEEEQLLSVAGELKIAVEEKSSGLGDYYYLGQVGDSRVNAVKIKMGPLSLGGSASVGILFQQAAAIIWANCFDRSPERKMASSAAKWKGLDYCPSPHERSPCG